MNNRKLFVIVISAIIFLTPISAFADLVGTGPHCSVSQVYGNDQSCLDPGVLPRDCSISSGLHYIGNWANNVSKTCANITNSPANLVKSFFNSSTLKLFFLNIIIECGVAYIYLLFKKWITKRVLIGVLIVNIISWPLLFSICFLYPVNWVVFAGEIGVWVFEALGLYVISNKLISRRVAFKISAITNATSFFVGLILVSRS